MDRAEKPSSLPATGPDQRLLWCENRTVLCLAGILHAHTDLRFSGGIVVLLVRCGDTVFEHPQSGYLFGAAQRDDVSHL